ncbi:MAG: saccharopine dehydrogenase NADP-binding domain-containing protein [Saprospiraceae bacterium]|nr:saccharopine dehydrogenase NADP-binding domain-containing protein [Saprospiraceae bacterium]
MKKILVFGAGRSATTLIRFLGDHTRKEQWQVTVADASGDLVQQKVDGYPNLDGVVANVTSAKERTALIKNHDFIISMLPWTLHALVAKDCLRLGKHLITASYVNADMRELAAKARKKGLFFMGELGLDPGLDHMSALRLIRQIKASGGHITSFHSYAGGLIAEESDTNPWHYKITWNPRNVILAGQGTAQYRDKGQLRLVPYHHLFGSAMPIAIDGKDRYEVYANRDSLKYISMYGLTGIPSIMRGTVRIRGFCKAWDALVKLGLTDSVTPLGVAESLTWKQLIAGLLPDNPSASVRSLCADYLGLSLDDVVMDQLAWLGLFSDQQIGDRGLAPADYLQNLLTDKWKLEPQDRDLVVMEHRIHFDKGGQSQEIRSSLHHEGSDQDKTAMADLVGLPLAHATRLFLNGQLNEVTLPVPFEPCIAEPILDALAGDGITFNETMSLSTDPPSFPSLSN